MVLRWKIAQSWSATVVQPPHPISNRSPLPIRELFHKPSLKHKPVESGYFKHCRNLSIERNRIRWKFRIRPCFSLRCTDSEPSTHHSHTPPRPPHSSDSFGLSRSVLIWSVSLRRPTTSAPSKTCGAVVLQVCVVAAGQSAPQPRNGVAGMGDEDETRHLASIHN